jgi:exosortase/archaeosortase family protein
MMLSLNKITGAVKQIPAPVKSFLWKALVFFLVWQLIYNIYLLPNRVIDRPLCAFVGNGTASFINFVQGGNLAYCKTVSTFETTDGASYLSDRAIVFLGKRRLIGIADQCNGLNLYILFIGFVIVYPSKVNLKIAFVFFGIFFITMLNIARCAGLGLIHNSYPSMTDFAHHYAFKIITYLAIFFMWFWYVKFTNKIEASYA